MDQTKLFKCVQCDKEYIDATGVWTSKGFWLCDNCCNVVFEEVEDEG